MTKQKQQLQVYGATGYVDYELLLVKRNAEMLLPPTGIRFDEQTKPDISANTGSKNKPDLTAYENENDILLPCCMKRQCSDLKSANKRQIKPGVEPGVLLPNIN